MLLLRFWPVTSDCIFERKSKANRSATERGVFERRQGSWALEVELFQPVYPIEILLAHVDPQPGQESRGSGEAVETWGWLHHVGFCIQLSWGTVSFNSLCCQQKRPDAAIGNSSFPGHTYLGTSCLSRQLPWTCLFFGDLRGLHKHGWDLSFEV